MITMKSIQDLARVRSLSKSIRSYDLLSKTTSSHSSGFKITSLCRKSHDTRNAEYEGYLVLNYSTSHSPLFTSLTIFYSIRTVFNSTHTYLNLTESEYWPENGACFMASTLHFIRAHSSSDTCKTVVRIIIFIYTRICRCYTWVVALDKKNLWKSTICSSN